MAYNVCITLEGKKPNRRRKTCGPVTTILNPSKITYWLEGALAGQEVGLCMG
jgi:hypothetical protein